MNNDIQDLEQKIKEARYGKEADEQEKTRIRRELNNKAGMQAGMEFVASIGFSAFIGYWLDQWLGTMPLFFILLFMIGVGAGFLSIFRASKNLGSAVGYSELHKRRKEVRKAPELKPDED
ncbi:MAG: AtpZ/AtpI family protein [Alphaproteobacteria bacterium]|nr:AtpZ/AtpI family protein [Alphaproteobacteria bacterium]